MKGVRAWTKRYVASDDMFSRIVDIRGDNTKSILGFHSIAPAKKVYYTGLT